MSRLSLGNYTRKSTQNSKKSLHLSHDNSSTKFEKILYKSPSMKYIPKDFYQGFVAKMATSTSSHGNTNTNNNYNNYNNNLSTSKTDIFLSTEKVNKYKKRINTNESPNKPIVQLRKDYSSINRNQRVNPQEIKVKKLSNSQVQINFKLHLNNITNNNNNNNNKSKIISNTSNIKSTTNRNVPTISNRKNRNINNKQQLNKKKSNSLIKGNEVKDTKRINLNVKFLSLVRKKKEYKKQYLNTSVDSIKKVKEQKQSKIENTKVNKKKNINKLQSCVCDDDNLGPEEIHFMFVQLAIKSKKCMKKISHELKLKYEGLENDYMEYDF